MNSDSTEKDSNVTYMSKLKHKTCNCKKYNKYDHFCCVQLSDYLLWVMEIVLNNENSEMEKFCIVFYQTPLVPLIFFKQT